MQHREWVSRYRDELKGLAVLWVIFFHLPIILPGSWDLFRFFGYGGVDIMLFLMGMGLYRSLQQRNELRGYLSRRLWRMLPSYYPWVIVWMAVYFTFFRFSTVPTLSGIMGNLTFAGFWMNTQGQLNWFPSAWMLMILLAPICYAFLSQSKKPEWVLAVLLAISLGAGVAAIGLDQLITVSRLPIFILGMAFGMDWTISKKRKWVAAAYGAAFVAGVAMLLYTTWYQPDWLLFFGMFWYPFLLITPGLCVFLAWGMEKLSKTGKWLTPLRFFGERSLEVYLVNVGIEDIVKEFKLKDVLLVTLIELGGIVLAVGYYWLVQRMTPKLQQWVKQRAAGVKT